MKNQEWDKVRSLVGVQVYYPINVITRRLINKSVSREIWEQVYWKIHEPILRERVLDSEVWNQLQDNNK